MEIQEVELIIEPDGRVRIQVRGASGMACLDLTRDLEAALGDWVERRELTPEAYEAFQQALSEAERLRRKQS